MMSLHSLCNNIENLNYLKRDPTLFNSGRYHSPDSKTPLSTTMSDTPLTAVIIAPFSVPCRGRRVESGTKLVTVGTMSELNNGVTVTKSVLVYSKAVPFYPALNTSSPLTPFRFLSLPPCTFCCCGGLRRIR